MRIKMLGFTIFAAFKCDVGCCLTGIFGVEKEGAYNLLFDRINFNGQLVKAVEVSYCKIALVVTPKMDVEEVLNELSITKFNAERAVQCNWNNNQFLIDSGMNNIRAVVDNKRKLILFSCRYPHYIDIAEELVIEFAGEQALLIEKVDV